MGVAFVSCKLIDAFGGVNEFFMGGSASMAAAFAEGLP